MKKEIQLHNKKVEYTLRKSKRAKRLRIAVYCDASIVVTMPYKIKEGIVEKFIISKSKWILEKLDIFKKTENILYLKFSKKDYIRDKGEAYYFVVKIIEKYNNIYKFKFNKIIIKNQKTKWGSCSKKKNLNFNYKLLFLPEKLASYIIVHELCHLKEMNHSAKFWGLVSKTFPEYREMRRELKKILL